MSGALPQWIMAGDTVVVASQPLRELSGERLKPTPLLTGQGETEARGGHFRLAGSRFGDQEDLRGLSYVAAPATRILKVGAEPLMGQSRLPSR